MSLEKSHLSQKGTCAVKEKTPQQRFLVYCGEVTPVIVVEHLLLEHLNEIYG